MSRKTLTTSAHTRHNGAEAIAEQWHQLCLGSPVGIGVIDLDFRVAEFNASLAAFLQFPLNAERGITLERAATKVADTIRTAAKSVMNTGKSVQGVTLEIESQRVPKTGGADRADFNPVLDSDQRLVGVSCVIIDITAEKEVERELKDRLAFEKLLSDLSARFVNLAVDQVDAEINRSIKHLVEFLDVDRSLFWQFLDEYEVSVLGAYCTSAVPAVAVGQSRVFKRYQKELRQGHIVCFRKLDEVPADWVEERTVSLAEGLKSHVGIPINVGGMPLCGMCISTFREERVFDPHTISGLQMVGEVFANAVSRRKADQELRLMQSELFHVTRVSTVGQLAASIAHEINQPLCAIVNNVQAATRLAASGSDADMAIVRTALRDIASDSKRAGDVVARARELLQRRGLDFKPLGMNDVLQDVIGLVRSDAIVRRVNLECDLANDLPLVLADRVQIQQVLLNLLVNGMDAIGDQSPDLRRVIVRTSATNEKVRVSVLDSGAGLKPEVAQRMFDPFFTTKRDGLGMGLTINRTIIEAHGGSLWAEPNGKRGAVLVFELPVVRD